MPNVIVFIHGLGNKPPKNLLENWWKRALIEGLTQEEQKSFLPKTEMVFWIDLLYDKLLDPSETNPESPYYIDEPYVKAQPETVWERDYKRLSVIDYLGSQLNRIFLNDELSLNYSIITDSIVSKYFRELDTYYKDDCLPDDNAICTIKIQIRERLIKVLEKYKNHDIMLVSHSMGTIIAYDVLSYLAPDIKIHTFVTMGSPLGLPVVLAKIAAEQRRRNITPVQIITPENITHVWYNFSDILDKVAFKYRLNDVFLPNAKGISPIDFLVANTYKVNGEPNPHKSFGYLRTPQMSSVTRAFIKAERLTFMQKIARWLAIGYRILKSRIQKHQKPAESSK
ncbi:MAG: hypothetical protein CVU09_08550 [Bacteroidetes bacterium HGW-Bacteroidetes-4]|jgi:hypothetical protein|nr:MAG: hypothetical protein CVU09_08550 [Bacteroidetes bacterium HGW-Bacteroidetes-4]